MASICCAAGKGTAVLIEALLELWEKRILLFEQLIELLFAVFAGIRAHQKVFIDSKLRENQPSLRNIGNAVPDNFVRLHFGDIPAVKRDGSGSGVDKTGDGRHERRFARAVCADDGDNFALVHMEGNIAERTDFVVIYADILYV